MNRQAVAKELVRLAADLARVKALDTLTERELTRALREAIIDEETAVIKYETIVDSTDNEMVAKVLQDIADEERVHIGELQKLLSLLLPDEQGFLDEGAEEVEDE